MFTDVRRGGLQLRTATSWCKFPLVHGFSDRHGGVSEGAYASLNIGLHVGDEPESVVTNRKLLFTALGWEPGDVVVGEQVHGNRIAVVEERDKGRGVFTLNDCIPGVDGLVTATPGIGLLALFADCVPVLLYDPDGPAVGVVHAGWRGTVANAVGSALRVLTKRYGTRADACYAAIGPAIGPCCYAVGSEVAMQLGQAATENGDAKEAGAAVVTEVEGRRYVDLQRLNELLLLRCGVPAANISVDRSCTRCADDRFFSFRAAGGTTGRTAAFIGLTAN